MRKCGILIVFFITVSLFAQEKSKWETVPEEIKARKFFKRTEWFLRPRTTPGDTIPLTKLNGEYQKEKKKAEKSNTKDSPEWQPIGPKGITSNFPTHWGVSSGRIKAIDVHPLNPDIVYIGAASGGLWKTNNGGESWVPIGENLSSLTFGAVAVDPINPETIYAGTGETMSYYSTTIYYGSGIYKSTDGGNTWDKVGNELGTYTHTGDLVVSSHDNNYVYAALAGGNVFLGNPGNGGVWVSTDAGDTWIRTLSTDMSFDLELHPTDPNIVYASVGGLNTQAGFYKSTDKGFSWTKKSSGLIPSQQISRMQFSICKSDPQNIYVVIFGGPTTAWKTTNGGNNWIQVSSNNPLGGYHESLGWYDQGMYDLCIAVDPEQSKKVFIGNVEFHKTSNGENFNVVRQSPGVNVWSSPMHCDYHKIVYAPSDPNIIYVGSDGGIFKSTDRGSTWQHKNNGISTIQFYWMASHPTNRDLLIGGSQDNGNFRTMDRGLTNWELTTTGDGQVCFYDYEDPSYVYYSIQYGSLYRSNSGGGFGTVTNISPEYEGGDSPYWTAPFFIHPNNPEIIYSASNKLWKSTNRGGSWTQLSSSFGASFNSMHQHRYYPNIIAGVAGGNFSSDPGVYVTTTEGLVWNNVAENIPGEGKFIPSIKTDPNFMNYLYIVKSGFGSGKVYKSTDLGDTWNDISGNLPDIPHNDILIDPEIPEWLYVANDFGVYQTTDGGINWEIMDHGMPIVPVLKLDYAKYGSDRILRAATYGKSAYEAVLPNYNNQLLMLTCLLGGEKIIQGTQTDIRWLTHNIGTISIYFSSNDGKEWNSIAENIPSENLVHAWDVPEIQEEECLIKLVDDSGALPDQISDAFFSIIEFSAPQLKLPVDGEMAQSLNPSEFTWEETAGKVFYEFQLAGDEQFTNTIFSDDKIVDNFVEVNNLNGFTQYYWRVKAINDNLETPFSEERTFTTQVDKPALIYPNANSSDIPTSFQFLWEGVNGADTYHIQLSSNIQMTELVVNDSTLAENSFDITGLEGNKRYFWKVCGKNQFGSGDFSITRWFRTGNINDLEPEVFAVPKELRLSQNYPNPFNPSTNIKVEIPEEGFVNLMIYNLLGEVVAEIENGVVKPGYYEFTFDADKLQSGIYFYRVNFQNKSITKKMLLLR